MFLSYAALDSEYCQAWVMLYLFQVVCLRVSW